MTGLHVACLLAVAVAGTATVLIRKPLRQAVASGVLGLSLAVLFLAFGAPDVALSQIVVGVDHRRRVLLVHQLVPTSDPAAQATPLPEP